MEDRALATSDLLFRTLPAQMNGGRVKNYTFLRNLQCDSPGKIPFISGCRYLLTIASHLVRAVDGAYAHLPDTVQ